MNPVADLIAALGGTSATARLLGAPVSTVDTWKREGRIPSWRIDAVRKAAEDASITFPEALEGRAA